VTPTGRSSQSQWSYTLLKIDSTLDLDPRLPSTLEDPVKVARRSTDITHRPTCKGEVQKKGWEVGRSVLLFGWGAK